MSLNGPTSATAAASAVASRVVPRLLSFYRDTWDDDGTVTGWETVAWGLVLPDGSVISVPVTAPVRVTLWHSLDNALAELDAYVDELDPRRTIDAGDVQPLPRPSTVPPPAGMEGAASEGACPDQPAADDRGRPPGPNTAEPPCPPQRARR